MNNIIKDSPHNVYVLHSNGDEQIIYDSKTRFKVIRKLSTSVECKRPFKPIFWESHGGIIKLNMQNNNFKCLS